ncbi:PrsW family intramembrane metalloprotease [Streptodolium elevatio]|uniref:PrsW family intramembrane metalloprotease n=1 Tax=Streptodolium elevatio TaxID=3157996 RepID=A0ABV3DR59_9ACTN
MTGALSVRSFSLWVGLAACVFGAISLGLNYFDAVRVFPAATMLAAGLLVPTLVFGYALARRVRPVRPPPGPPSVACVVWGMTAATGCAVIANTGLGAIWARTCGVQFADDWSAALTAPWNEETLKLCGVVMLTFVAARAVRGPVDGWVYGALVGLGFQATENLMYALNNILLQGATSPGGSVVGSFVVRVLLTGWGSHWAMTAVAGTGIGFLVARDGTPLARRIGIAVVFWALAMAMHWQFNAPILGFPGGIVVKVAVNLVVALLVFRAVRRGYRARLGEVAQEEAAYDTVRPSEARTLLGRRSRVRARRIARTPTVRARIADVQERQLDLLEARLPTADPDTLEIAAELRAEVAAARARL